MTSVDLKLNYLSAKNRSTLIALSNKIKIGRTLGYGQAQVIDETGKILAQRTSTLMVIPDLPLKFDRPLSPKFL